MINVYRLRRQVLRLHAALQQLPRLVALRLHYEQREPAKENFLTRLHDDRFGAYHRREHARRACMYWFFKGAEEYKGSTRHNELLAHLHTYIESGGSIYLKRAERGWNETLLIEHNHDESGVFWIDRAPTSLRLIEEDKQTA